MEKWGTGASARSPSPKSVERALLRLIKSAAPENRTPRSLMRHLEATHDPIRKARTRRDPGICQISTSSRVLVGARVSENVARLSISKTDGEAVPPCSTDVTLNRPGDYNLLPPAPGKANWRFGTLQETPSTAILHDFMTIFSAFFRELFRQRTN
jgi:hypothetical protein